MYSIFFSEKCSPKCAVLYITSILELRKERKLKNDTAHQILKMHWENNMKKLIVIYAGLGPWTYGNRRFSSIHGMRPIRIRLMTFHPHINRYVDDILY